MIQQTIFDIDEPLDKKNLVVTFDLPPSQQLFNIRSILSARKRKSSSSSSSPLSSSTSSGASSPSLSTASSPPRLVNNSHKKQKLAFDDMISGLPSPPVDSPSAEFPSLSNDSTADDTPPLTPNMPSAVTTNASKSCCKDDIKVEEKQDDLSAEQIKAKIAALREEKHNLFQLMKRLVEQEEQQQQQKKLIELQQQQQQQQQPDLKKKKTSRWSLTNNASTTPSPTSSTNSFQKEQQQQPLSTRAPFNNKSLNSRTLSSFHYQHSAAARPNSYYGQRQAFSHRPSYLY